MLVSGGEYRWTIAPILAQQDEVLQGTFTVASATVRAQFQQSTPAQDGALSDWLLYAMALDQANMVTDSNRVLRIVAEKRPLSDTLRELVR